MVCSKTELSSPETALRVHDLLRAYADENGFVSASLTDLAAELVIGRETARRAVARLIADDGLSVARRGTGHRYPTTYRVAGWPKTEPTP